jgi:hypothetical protein
MASLIDCLKDSKIFTEAEKNRMLSLAASSSDQDAITEILDTLDQQLDEVNEQITINENPFEMAQEGDRDFVVTDLRDGKTVSLKSEGAAKAWINTQTELNRATRVQSFSLTPQLKNMALSGQTLFQTPNLPALPQEVRLPYTLKVFDAPVLKNKPGKLVHKSTIKQALSEVSATKIEKDVVGEALKNPEFEEKDKISYDLFRSVVEGMLVPIKPLSTLKWSDYGSDLVGMGSYSANSTVYNSPIPHGVVGHFGDLFGSEATAEKVEYQIKPVPQSPGTYVAMDRNMPTGLTAPEEISPYVGTAGSLEQVRAWVAEYNSRDEKEIIAGMFGWARRWEIAGSTARYVGEMQSDFFQQSWTEPEKRAGKNIVSKVEMSMAKVVLNHPQTPDQQVLANKYQEVSDKIKNTPSRIKDAYRDINKDYLAMLDWRKKKEDAAKQIEKKEKELRLHQEENTKLLAEIDKFRYEKDGQVYIKEEAPSEKAGQIQSRIGVLKETLIPEEYDKHRQYSQAEESSQKVIDDLLRAERQSGPRFDEYAAAMKEKERLIKAAKKTFTLEQKQFYANRQKYMQRIVKEEIRAAAMDGMKVLYFPTARTIATAEGFVQPRRPGEEAGARQVDEGFNGMYEVTRGQDEGPLEPGDEIDYGGEGMTVFSASGDGRTIEVVPTDDVQIWSVSSWMDDEHYSEIDNAAHEFKDVIVDLTLKKKFIPTGDARQMTITPEVETGHYGYDLEVEFELEEESYAGPLGPEQIEAIAKDYLEGKWDDDELIEDYFGDPEEAFELEDKEETEIQESFTLDWSDLGDNIGEKIWEWMEEYYDDESIEERLQDYGYAAAYVHDGWIYTSYERDAETFPQPSEIVRDDETEQEEDLEEDEVPRAETSVELDENFLENNFDNLSDENQTIVQKYIDLEDILTEVRGKEPEIHEGPHEYTWYKVDITEEDKDQVRLYQAIDPGSPLGAVDIKDGQYFIHLFERANMSTLIHETGHVFMEEMARIAESTYSSDQIKKDYQSLLKFAGAENQADLTDAGREKLAKAFEAYLMEGKAPTQELVGAFGRFRDWLLSVYQNVAGLGVELTDEVRGVFDRMLSTRQEVVDTALSYNMNNLTNEEMNALGIVSEDRDYMRRLIKEFMLDAEEEMNKDRNRNRRKLRKDWVKSAKAEVDNMRVFKLMHYLSRTLPKGLDTDTLIEMFGEDIIGSLPVRVPPIHAKGGIDPRMVATDHDYATAYEMMTDLVNAPLKKDAIARIVAEKQKEHDAQYQAEDYIAASKKYADYLLILNKYVERAAGRPTEASPTQTFKLVAMKALSKLSVRNAIQHHKFLSFMKSNARIERQKAQQGKWEEASEANEKVRLNYEQARLSIKHRKFVEKTIKKLKKSARSKTIAHDYRENLLALAQRFGMGTQTMIPLQPEEKVALANLLTYQEGDLDDSVVFFSDWLVSEKEGGDYRDLTMEQFQELGNLISYLAGKGREVHNQVLSDGKTKRNDVVDEVVAEGQGLKTVKKSDRFSMMRKIKDGARTYIAWLTSLQFMSIALGGFQNVGKKGQKSAAEKYLFDTLVEARNQEIVLFDDIYKKIEPHYLQLNRAIQRMQKKYGRRMRVPDTAVPAILYKNGQEGWWSADQVIAIALNMGNESNIQRLRDGYEDLTDDTLNNLLDLLTKEDWDAIQGIWDTIDTLFPMINEVHRKINHYPLAKIEAAPVITKFGTYRGGYYPAAYDRSLPGAASVRVASWSEKDDIMARAEATYQVPATKSSFRKARAEGKVALPLKLSLSVLIGHLTDTTHDITHGVVVRDIDKILNTPKLVEHAQDVLGMEMFASMKAGLKYAARPEAENRLEPDKFVGWLKGATTVFTLAWNAGVAMKQVFSSPAAIYEIGLTNYIKGFDPFTKGSPITLYNQMQELSPYMRNRSKNMDRELRDVFNKMTPAQRTLFFGDKHIAWSDVRNFGFWPIRLADMMTVIPIWHGSFQKRLKETDGDVNEAVRYADEIVRKTQPSAQPIDLTQWQREGGAIRLFSLFQTFTVGKYGQRQRLHYNAWRNSKISHADYLWFTFCDAILPGLAMSLLFSVIHGADMDDPETWSDIGTDMLKYWLLTGLPLIGQLWSPYGGPLDSPVAQGPDSLQLLIRNVWKFSTERDEETFKKAMWSFFEVASFMSGVPASQVVKKFRKGLEQDEENIPYIKYIVPAPKKK